MAAGPIVTLTTDFGTTDYYVGAMKGVMLDICADLQIVDLSHHIPPHDILSGAFLLRHAAGEFPAGTTHLAVVDPGVGSQRRAMVVRSRGFVWVGPDNGLLSFALQDGDCVAREIRDPELCRERLSPTFHGRDLFAPAAAHLASGYPFENAGPAIADPVILDESEPQRTPTAIVGQVIHVDQFGNLVTNISGSDLESWGPQPRLRLSNGRVIDGLSRTYADVGDGNALALIGSSNLLEISINGGDASRELRVARRDTVTVERGQTDA